MTIGIAVAMMVLMCGGMLFMKHGDHKHGKKDKQETVQESAVKKSTEPVPGANTPHADHEH